MSMTKPYPLPVNGVDLISNETSLIKGTVREAVNVDIGRAGTTARRTGQTQLVARGDLHSLWYSAQRAVAFVGAGTSVNALLANNSLVKLADLVTNDPLHYVEYNGNVYWTNISTMGWLPANTDTARAVGVPTPNAPILSPTNGALLPGKYGVCVTFVDDRGEEGGASDVKIIDLPAGGGITLSGLATHNGWQMYVYITDPNGAILHLAATPPATFTSYAVAGSATGSECSTEYLKPMPPGEFVAWLGGRLYTAKNDVLSFSEALRPHLYNPAHNFVQFSGQISFVEAVLDGLYVGDSRGVWFLSGSDPSKFMMSLVSTCRAVRRSGIKVPSEHFTDKKITTPNPVALWLSTSGYVVGMDGGVTVELHPDRVKVPPGLVGRTTYLFRKGLKQVVTPVNSTSTVASGTAVDSVIP